MAGKLKVEYNKSRCIGNGSCAAIAPGYFELHGRKAELLNSNQDGRETYSIEVDANETDANILTDAAIACPVNAIRVFDMEKNRDIVDVKVSGEDIKGIEAKYDDAKEFVLDKKGYFLIRLDRANKSIEVAFCNNKNKISLRIIGKNPLDIYYTIINKEKLSIRKDHAAYLGRELEKAYIALRHNLEYIQDDELDLNKKINR
mgnify:CR=1 FL=1